MKDKTLGQYLLGTIKASLKSKDVGRVVRPRIDVTAVRKKLGMTQKKFSEQYHINLQTLRNWEQKKRAPDTTTLAYLTCIAKHPKEILKFLSQ